MADEIITSVRVAKASKKLGLVYGYAVVSKVKNEKTGEFEPFYDQGSLTAEDRAQHVPEPIALSASAEFMRGQRAIEEEHFGPKIGGMVVYGLYVDEEIAKSLGWEIKQTGFVVAVKPDDAAVLDRVESGELKGFSIFGSGAAVPAEAAA